MVLRILAFATCDIDDNWYLSGKNKRFMREMWDPNAATTIEAKLHGAAISIDAGGKSIQHLKFKNKALVTIRGHVLAFDTSSLMLET
jgi:hypothetical protein